jgi:hypothetical protein
MTVLAGAAAYPLLAGAQQKAMPVIGYLKQHLADTGRSGLGRIPARLERNRLRRGTKRGD